MQSIKKFMKRFLKKGNLNMQIAVDIMERMNK